MNQVFYRLPRLNAKLCKTRVGSEGRGRSPKGHVWPRVEPEDHREGLAGAALGQENKLQGETLSHKAGLQEQLLPSALLFQEAPLSSVIFMLGQKLKEGIGKTWWLLCSS